MRRSTIFSWIAGVSALGAFFVALAPALGQEINPGREYRECMAMARSDPELGFGRATSWLGLGGGDAARHCQAVSLLGLGQHQEGARRLEELAQEIKAPPRLRAELFAQAAQAWLLAGQAARAESVLNSALSIDPGNPELFIDRAQAAAAMDRWAEAAGDLAAALVIDPDLVDALVFRASAHRHLGEIEDAEADAKRALELDPGNLEARLESGILHRLAGRRAEARGDWLEIVRRAPGTPAALSARQYLQRMDGPRLP